MISPNGREVAFVRVPAKPDGRRQGKAAWAGLGASARRWRSQAGHDARTRCGPVRGGLRTVGRCSSIRRFHSMRSSRRMALRRGARRVRERKSMTSPLGLRRSGTRSNRIRPEVSRRFGPGLKAMREPATRGSSIESPFKVSRRSKSALDWGRVFEVSLGPGGTPPRRIGRGAVSRFDAIYAVDGRQVIMAARSGEVHPDEILDSRLERFTLEPSGLENATVLLEMPGWALSDPLPPGPTGVWSHSGVHRSMNRSIAVVGSGSSR